MTQIHKIFISYRRADNAIFVEGIRNWLIHRYGRENVFMDFDGIRAFSDFQTFIEKRIAESDAVIVIIGPDWLKLLNEKAAELDIDYVRIEIEEALAQKKLLAPIRILDANAPRPTQLPEALRPLCRIHAPVLNGGTHFLDHIERIIEDLEAAFIEKVGLFMTAEQYVDRAHKRFDNGDSSGALADANEALRIESSNADAYYIRGVVHVDKENYDHGIADLTESLRLNPNDPLPYVNRGIALEAKGELEGAIADWREAIRLGIPSFLESEVKEMIAEAEEKFKQRHK